MEHVDVVRNRITGGGAGIFLGGESGTPPCSHNRIVENTIDGGIEVVGVGNLLRDNIVQGISAGPDNFVENNYVASGD